MCSYKKKTCKAVKTTTSHLYGLMFKLFKGTLSIKNFRMSSNSTEEVVAPSSSASWSWWPSWLQWRPTSFQLLEAAEKKMLEGITPAILSIVKFELVPLP